MIPYLFRVSQDVGFSGFFRVQVCQGLGPGFRSSPKVDRRLKLFTFTSWYLCLQFFFFFKYQRKKIFTPNLIVALLKSFHLYRDFCFQRGFSVWSHKKFPIAKNLSVTQTMLIFYIWMRMCVNFVKHSIDFFSANFIFVDVRTVILS